MLRCTFIGIRKVFFILLVTRLVSAEFQLSFSIILWSPGSFDSCADLTLPTVLLDYNYTYLMDIKRNAKRTWRSDRFKLRTGLTFHLVRWSKTYCKTPMSVNTYKIITFFTHFIYSRAYLKVK